MKVRATCQSELCHGGLRRPGRRRGREQRGTPPAANDNAPPAPHTDDPFAGGETLRLWMGDCLEQMRRIPDRSVHLILCDLPYGTTAYRWDKIIPFDALWEEYRRIIVPTGAIVLFGSQPFTAKLAASNLEWLRDELVWKKSTKTDFLRANAKHLKEHEAILVFSPASAVVRKGVTRMTYNPQGLVALEKPIRSRNGLDGREYSGKRIVSPNVERVQTQTNYPTSILEFASVKDPVHPTEKPVDLLTYLIRTYSNTGDVVLDNCMGSGSSGEAALIDGRKFIGIEREPKFYAQAMGRLADVYARVIEPSVAAQIVIAANDNGDGVEVVNDDAPLNRWKLRGMRRRNDRKMKRRAGRARRLVATEWERLQGVADGHTLIPWNGRIAKESLTKRAVGNSLPVPVVRWIGERIVAAKAAKPGYAPTDQRPKLVAMDRAVAAERGPAMSTPPEPVAAGAKVLAGENYKLIVADCLAALKQMPDRSVAIIMMSPPYNLREKRRAAFPRSCLWKDAPLAQGYASHADDLPYPEYIKWQHEVLSECWRVLTDDGVFFTSTSRASWAANSAIRVISSRRTCRCGSE